jgi:hypothetical protein
MKHFLILNVCLNAANNKRYRLWWMIIGSVFAHVCTTVKTAQFGAQIPSNELAPMRVLENKFTAASTPPARGRWGAHFCGGRGRSNRRWRVP